MHNDNTDLIQYNVVSVEKIKAPEGLSGDSWHRYVIGKGNSRIEGKKPGSLLEVTRHAESVVEDLNSRKARGGSTYVPRTRSKTS
jgi:hypothetical protein